MAKFHLRTSSSSYQKAKTTFLAELKQFHEGRGTPIRHMPVMNGKEIDLYYLYMLVTHHGGWVKVNGQGLWDNMLKQLDLPSACVNGGVAIRHMYLRYLERWERIKGGGAVGGVGDVDLLMGEMDDDRPRRSGYGAPKARNTITFTYNHTQHNVPDHIRETNGLSPLQRLGGAMERMALSLLSPLPNEQDFALNVCTILAADSANKLPIISAPHIIDFLLGHAGVYNHCSLRDVIGRSYKEARSCNIEWYWLEHTRPSGTLELLDEERFPVQGLAMQAIVSQLSLKSYLANDGTMILPDDKDLPVFEEHQSAMLADEDGIMASRCPGGARDLISRRVGQVATIMRNLSFHEDNVSVLAKHQTFLRFILLSVNCSMSSIRQAGLDSLGNIAVELVVKDPATCLLSRHLFATITAALLSDDRARALAAMEVLNKLAQNESNEDVLMRCLEQKVYEQVCSYLTLHDIMLLVVTLECMYALTTLGEKSCDYIVKIHGVIDTLVSLITVEAQSYGPKACILMKVVETVSGTSIQGTNQQIQSNPPPAPVPTPPPVVSQPSQPVPLLQVAGQQTQSAIQLTMPSGQQVTSLTQPNNITVQQQHAHQQENEQFALAWLRATWEPCPNNIHLDASELYKQYLACCNKVGRKGVISPLHFPRCVRSVFGGVVGPNPVKTISGETLQFYMGVRQRTAPQSKAPMPSILPQANIKTGPASPILKAQLCKIEQQKIQENTATTPKSPPLLQIGSPVSTTNPPPMSATPSNLQSANTTLIKHLLAHKVSAAPAPPVSAAVSMDRMQPQVTQRQNQQKMMGQTPPTVSVPISSPNPMEIDAEALISCSTITSTGVTSTNPSQIPTVKVTTTPGIANLPDPSVETLQRNGNESTAEDNPIKLANPMLSTLVEKKSSPPRIPHPRPSVEEDDEPATKKSRNEVKPFGVSSTAANLYAALAASALEDEEELLAAQNEAQQNSQASALKQEVQQPVVKIEPPVVKVEPPPPVKVEPEQQEPETPRQVIVPAIQNQQGQLILHASTPGKAVVAVPGTQYVPPLQLIATSNNQQGLGYVPGGVMPHKTIIILQGGNTNGQITLTVNNSGGALDENTLNSLISQATDAINQQQLAANAVMTSTGVIQGTQQLIQPTQAIIQANPAILNSSPNMMNSTGVIKQQIIQGQAQLVTSQQPVITQQPQPQILVNSNSHQIVTTQSNQQMIVQTSQPQQFITGNQQMLIGSPQLMMGNQQIIVGNQQMISGTQIISSGTQQFVQQRILGGNQIIVDQQGNRQILSANQNIVIANQQTMNAALQQQEKKNLINNPNNQINQNINRNVQTSNKVETVQQQNIVVPPVSPRKIPDEPWVCQWRGCDTVFESAAAVYLHACNVHCTRAESPCLWIHCDQLPRRKFSLMTHLQDRHCSTDALKTSHAQRRKGIVPSLPSTPSTNPAPSSTMERIDSPGMEGSSSHPGYAMNAAIHAIKRHAVDLHPRELMQRAEASRNTVETPDDNEGPVTKSIRLTAALILRNIVIYSHIGRRLLRGYEPHLAGIALSSVEASRTVAQVLYDMNCI